MRFKAHRMIPVVAVTAFTDDSTKERAKAVGMSELLHKPVDISDLSRVLN